MSKETRLDVLTNNAGVMTPPKGSKDSHGRELQLGTNTLGPFLFTELLVPILLKTAKSSPTGTVRVTWASSSGASLMSPKGGVQFAADGEPNPFWDNSATAYGQTKAANCLLASEFANRYAKDGIISVSWNPGNLRSELQRHVPGWQLFILNAMLYPAVYGAYTELWAGWSPDVTASHNGAYIGPWGRVLHIRKDVETAMKSEKEGGTGVAEKFWAWCDKTTKQYR